MAVKLLPANSDKTVTFPSRLGSEVAEREIVPFEPYRDRQSGEKAWLIMAGLTWDYMYYPHLHAVKKAGRVKFAHIVYDTIPTDFPQFVPNAAHIYHRHFVEIAQTGDLMHAISEFSAERFVESVLKPNLLEVPVSSHGLPDFIVMDGEVAEKPSPKLAGKDFVLFCSTIEARKNHLLLIHVWLKLLDRRDPSEVPTLVFVGKWGWAFETVKNHVDLNPKLANKVLVLSDVSDAELIWLYRNSKLGVFPSFAEGWGLAASESLLNGTPVVISDAPALKEATQGLMPALDPTDVEAWTQTIDRYLFDAVARDELQAAADRFVALPTTSFADKLFEGMRELS